jgi:GDP-L-fucose synthase
VLYVEDFVTDLLELADRVDNELVNIGAGEEHTIAEFARRICTTVGSDPGRIQYDPARYVGAKSKCLDIAKLRRLLGDRPRTPLDVGLARTIDWFKQVLAGEEKA